MHSTNERNNKLAQYGTGGRLLLTANYSHVTQKLGKIQKSALVSF